MEQEMFTIPVISDRSELLLESIEIIQYSDTYLGPEISKPRQEERKKKAIDYVARLQQEQAIFSPKLDVRQLTIDDFENQKTSPSKQIQTSMENNNFFYIGIPITLFPKSGWAFTRLECWLEFCPGESDSHNRATVHDMFPDDEWTELLSFEDNLRVGLNASLSFCTKYQPLSQSVPQGRDTAKAKIDVDTGTGAKLILGPFSYKLRRAKVRSRGRGNVECFWRLEGKQYVDEEDIQLGVVLRVPKGRKPPINVCGQLRTCHEFQSLSADIFKDWFNNFTEVAKSFFQNGMPLTVAMTWNDITRM